MMENMDVVTPASTMEPTEKMVPQSHVDAIVKREKAKVAENLQREFEQRQAQTQSQPATPPVDISQIEQRILEEAEKRFEQKRQQELLEMQQAEQQRVLDSVALQYHDKMAKAKGKEVYPDFDEIMADFEPGAFPSTVFLANEYDNTADIMYELSKHPLKLQALENLAKQPGSILLARREMKALADSIAKNQAAKQSHASTPAPLSKIKSSPGTGVADGKPNFKGASWLKG